MGGFDSLVSLLLVGDAESDGFPAGGGLPQPSAAADRTTIAKPITQLGRVKPQDIGILQDGNIEQGDTLPVVSLSLPKDLG